MPTDWSYGCFALSAGGVQVLKGVKRELVYLVQQNQPCMRLIYTSLLIITLALSTSLRAQPTVGLLGYEPGQQKGYVLFSPIAGTTTYLIDKKGLQVNSWVSKYKPGHSAYLLPDGSLLRSGMLTDSYFKGTGAGGIIERYSWDGKLIWSFTLSDSLQCQHHDIYPMPNGNILAIVWEKKAAEDIPAHPISPNESMIWTEKIVEIRPEGASGKIIWEWKVWDHLIQQEDPSKKDFGAVAEHPERISMHYTSAGSTSQTIDWIHLNSISYNAELDQIMVSSYGFSEIWVIDHSTTTQEAAAHQGGRHNKGGDLIYRWGNPMAYNRGQAEDRRLFHQHTAYWIPKGYKDEGKIMILNNGIDRPNGNYSSVDVIAPPMLNAKTGTYLFPEGYQPFGPASPAWSYADSANFRAPNISGAQRLPNGNTLICNGPFGHFFEITPQNKIVWQYKSPVWHLGVATQGTTIMGNFVFRSTLYPPDYAAFKGRKLLSGEPIELNADTTIPTMQSQRFAPVRGLQ